MKKAVLVTGASSGIGAETVLEFSRQGYFVYLLSRNKEAMEELGARCVAGASILKCDLTNEAEIQKAVKHVFERPDTDLQILINNAGIFKRQDLSSEQSLEVWREQFENNFFGVVRLTQLLTPYFLKRGSGSIVNVSSTLGLKPTADTSAYSAAKAAMVSWTQSLALALGKAKVRVNVVCPGFVDTPIHQFHFFEAEKKAQTLADLGPLQPLGRIGTSAEIAKSIYFLASEQSSFTTGAVLSVDGGIYLA